MGAKANSCRMGFWGGVGMDSSDGADDEKHLMI